MLERGVNAREDPKGAKDDLACEDLVNLKS